MCTLFTYKRCSFPSFLPYEMRVLSGLITVGGKETDLHVNDSNNTSYSRC